MLSFSLVLSLRLSSSYAKTHLQGHVLHSAACINAPGPAKGSESRGSGLKLGLGEHCWQICTGALLSPSAESIPPQSPAPWLAAKLCSSSSTEQDSVRSSVLLVQLGRCG